MGKEKQKERKERKERRLKKEEDNPDEELDKILVRLGKRDRSEDGNTSDEEVPSLVGIDYKVDEIK